MLNASGEIVSRKVMADAFGDETFSIGGAAIDRVSIDVTKDSSGDIGSLAISLRSTEELQPGSVAAGVRLAANDQNGQTLRTAVTVPSLTDPFTATATMSSKEWSSFIDGATSISIAATPSLRASAWGAAVPVLPAPAWATATLPVSSATYPVEVRESISDLTTRIAAIPSSSQSSLTLYEVPDLALLGTPDAPDDPSRLLVHSSFQALPFSDSTTHLIYVRNRWLDPGTGTWLTPDPMGYRDSSNLYAYAGGDPVNGRDPTGGRAMTDEDARILAMLKARGKKLHDEFSQTGRAAFQQPMRVPIDQSWWDTSGVPGANYDIQVIPAIVTNREAYELARRTMVNDVATFKSAVARADVNGDIFYVPGQGFTTVTTEDVERADRATMITAGIFAATNGPGMVGMQRVRTGIPAIYARRGAVRGSRNPFAVVPLKYRGAVRRAFQGRPTIETLKDDLVVYRRWGGRAEEAGSPWYAPQMYAKSGSARRYSALPESNSAEHVSIFVIPKGTTILRGKVASQIGVAGYGSYAAGGGQQIYLPDPSAAKLVRTIR